MQALFNDLLISVTSFFRDPEAWDALREQAIVPLIQRSDPEEPIRCWVPACATGEEAYTLAMLFEEELERRKLSRDFTPSRFLPMMASPEESTMAARKRTDSWTSQAASGS